MLIKQPLIVLIGSFILISGCAYNKLNDVVPDTDEQPTYADVSPIFQSQRCISCHNAAASQPPLLQDFDSFKSYITSNRTKFESAIKFEDADINKRMPLGGPKMPDNSINTILSWIEKGLKQ